MFTSDIIDILVENTNLYAIKNQSKYWLETNNDEMCALLGVIIMMGLHPLTDVELYWSTDDFYNNPVISRTMTLKRYKKLIENLHVSNPNIELAHSDPHYDKLSKIRPLLGILNNNFSSICSQSSTQSIDESMVKYKGRSSMKQYMPNKPIKRGYKVWARCDSETGYLYSFDIYTGKATSTDDNTGGLGYRVVMELCRNVQPYTLVAFDNFFTSLPLLEMLHHRNIYAVGTVRVHRKGLPPEITSKRGRRDPMSLKPGEFMFQHAAPVSVVKWMDSKDVFVATTAFHPKKVQIIQRKQKDGSKKAMFCPLPIVEYTKNMGGVDRFDHFRSSYSIGRKSKKNWFRLFWFLLEAALINAYILYSQGHVKRNNSHREFRLRVARGLVNNFSSRKASSTILKNKKGGVYGINDEVRLANVGVHMPTAGTKRRCRFCSTRTNPKRSKIECNLCKVPLCIAPCFAKFHLPYVPHNL
ncbi:piggyBac transposable element-derived protein 4-like [Hyposmocoma kahamanoa]|uniref:piggyBac transposable element-derived protein 4-like n=1 Tax=Hyposmocoma kahamanoa TaxID=1477025 RepID=UPI000E6D5FE6|nr:piggyBac transposable element-derived protein 4-like [Hyposmocoma kahamanoa]